MLFMHQQANDNVLKGCCHCYYQRSVHGEVECGCAVSPVATL